MFDKETIGKMKKGAYLVNNARGAIVDREAVVEACKTGQLGGDQSTTLFLLQCSCMQFYNARLRVLSLHSDIY